MRPRLLAAVVLVAVAASLLAFQPLRSPWWSGYDYDSVYVGSGLTLFRGERSNFYDHPGAPLQEGMAAIFTGAWLLSGDARDTRAEAWVANLDTTRVYLRTFASIVYVASALIVFATLAWLTRSAWWGLLAGLLFLSAPDVITWAAVVKPDPLLAALGVACVGLLVAAFRRRSGQLYLAAAVALGFDLSVKVQAVGLAVPLVLAALWRPPRPGWWTALRRDAAAWARAHRPWIALWLALVVALNALAAPPEAKPLAELVAGTAVLAAVSWAAWRLLRRTPLAGVVSAAIASAWGVLAGMVVPNLYYASVPGPMVRQAAITLSGGGVNSGAHRALAAWPVLAPWHVFIVVAALGLALALWRRDWSALLWAAGAVALGFLAYLRFGEIHYYTSAIAVAAGLVVLALRAVPVATIPVSALVAVAVLWQPFHSQIDAARARGREADRTATVNRWVASRLASDDVALTQLEASDARVFHLVHFYTQWAPEPDYRFLPADADAAQWVRDHDKRVAYLIAASPTNATATLNALGVAGRATRVDAAPGVVYRVAS